MKESAPQENLKLEWEWEWKAVIRFSKNTLYLSEEKCS